MKRLPTREEFKTLLNLLYKWDNKRRGLVFTANNGNELFFPALGYRFGIDVYSISYNGNYWTATPYDGFSALYLYFDSDEAIMGIYYCNYGRTIRLVSDEPCDGYIDMGTGVYWAPENYCEGRKIYFTWDEAMAIQDKVNGTEGLLMKKDRNTPELNITDTPNWEQRRYEIAKAALSGLLANPLFNDTTGIAKRAIKYADDMIKQLKQHCNERD